MLGTLRLRLMVSHVLPLLIAVPLMGIALIYVIENQVLLPNLSNQLAEQATLVAEIANDHIDIWHDPAQAQVFVVHVIPHLSARLMLLDPTGHLLASSETADDDYIGQVLVSPGLAQALAGHTSVQVIYSQDLRANAVDVLAPSLDQHGQVLGIVRLTHRLTNVSELFIRLRYLITGVLATGLVLGMAVGWILALNLGRPLQRVTLVIDQLASGHRLEPLPEQGPEEIRMLANSFNSLVGRLRTLEQNRRVLLTNLVHELGRPLGALHSAIQALQGGADEDTALRRELLAGTDEELGRLRRLLDDLARLHDQVLGTLELDRRPITLSEWLPTLLVTRREAAHQKGLLLKVDIPADLPTIEVDPDRLGQAVGNLVHNAIKYTPPGGSVSVEAGVQDRAIWIRVSDTGPGIAPEEQARIFTPFYRGRMGRRFPEGMGVGLSIARDLVIAHGGRLELASTPGQGSRFTLWLSSA